MIIYMHKDTGSTDTQSGWIASYPQEELEERGLTAEEAFRADVDQTLFPVDVAPMRYKVVSGEGEVGTVEDYVGTDKDVRNRMEQELCGGDRWIAAYRYSHESELGSVWVNIDTGEMRHFS